MTTLRNIPIFGLLIALTTLANGCANIGALNGGTKDATPPRVVTARSTPNFQTNFKKQTVRLVFDEYIKLEDAFNQVVVSPPLNERLTVESKDSRSVVLTFGKDEILRENATYTINFGNAVKDLNEGNIAKNLRFIFSTGDHIDSLTVVGRIVDAVSGLPVEGALLMLYDNYSDTVVRKSKPFYFGRTEKDGLARIENVREGSFKAFALVDKDQNYLFNQDVERVGFPDSLIEVSLKNNAPNLFAPDTSSLKKAEINENVPKFPRNPAQKDTTKGKVAASSNLVIRLFDPVKKSILLTKETDKYGVAKLIYNQEPTETKVNYDQLNQTVFTEVSKDTLLVFYDLNQDVSWNLTAKNDTFPTDTVRVRTKGRADFLKKTKFEALNVPKSISKHPTKPIVLTFTNPIQNIDSQRIELLDSAKNKVPLSIKRDSASPRKLQFTTNWQEGKRYTLQILPKALVDMYGLQNADTVAMNIRIQMKDEFGDLTLKINQLDSTKNYICQVIGGDGRVEKAFYIEQKKQFNARVETIQPDGYTIKIIEDTNKNRLWDTGNYDKRTQPERIFQKIAEPLRANWEVVVDIELAFE
jgi:Bacterial Ig-like domain